jgi:hypothetical protein
MQNLLFSPHILLFSELFCKLFYFKRPTLANSIQSYAPFPKYSKSIMFSLLASIFVKKYSRKFLLSHPAPIVYPEQKVYPVFESLKKLGICIAF